VRTAVRRLTVTGHAFAAACDCALAIPWIGSSGFACRGAPPQTFRRQLARGRVTRAVPCSSASHARPVQLPAARPVA